MQKPTVQQWGIGQKPAGFTPMSAAPDIASLSAFPPQLQEVIKAAVLKTIPHRDTDIFTLDPATGTFLVMRHSLQWQLNETASEVWLRLENPAKVEMIVEELCQKYPADNPQEIESVTVEFLLFASSLGLIDLFPDTYLEEKPEEDQNKG